MKTYCANIECTGNMLWCNTDVIRQGQNWDTASAADITPFATAVRDGNPAFPVWPREIYGGLVDKIPITKGVAIAWDLDTLYERDLVLKVAEYYAEWRRINPTVPLWGYFHTTSPLSDIQGWTSKDFVWNRNEIIKQRHVLKREPPEQFLTGMTIRLTLSEQYWQQQLDYVPIYLDHAREIWPDHKIGFWLRGAFGSPNGKPIPPNILDAYAGAVLNSDVDAIICWGYQAELWPILQRLI